MHLQLQGGYVRGSLLRTDIGGCHQLFVRGIGVLFAEKAVFLQTAQLGDGIFQFPGIFLDIHSITLGGLVGDGKIPGSIRIHFYYRVIDTAQLASFMSIISGESLRRICGEIVVAYHIKNRTHCNTSFPRQMVCPE